MAMVEKIRIRLSFEDANILSKSQRSDGLQCCWMLLRSDLHTISAFSSSIVSTFGLQKKCPNGLLLSMDDYILPQFETTNIFKDKDIIRIRKKDGKCRVICRDYTNESEDAPFKEKEQNFPCANHFPIKKSDEEHYGHGDKKDATYQLTDSTNEAGPSCKTPSMKRKRNGQFAPCEGCMNKFPVPAEVKETQSRNARRKKEKLLRERASWRKNKGHSPQPQIPQEAPARAIVEQNTFSEDDIVPVVVRPGHIRFKAQRKSSDVEQGSRQLYDDMFMHGKETETCNKSCEDNQKGSPSNRQGADTPEEGAKVHCMDFENLLLLTCLPKEGDVVAYRLVDLSTGDPEFSDFRVGKVSSFDPESMQSILEPVPGFPIPMDDDFSRINPKRYKEDGSLEIDFMSLLDVRLIRDSNSDMEAAADATINNPAGNVINDAPASEPCPTNNWDSASSENKQNQGRDWDEIKSPHRMETAETSEGWPQWKSREYLANTSWSFLLRAPLPRPSKKRRATGDCTWDAPHRSNNCKG